MTLGREADDPGPPTEPLRTRQAAAVARAAIETERDRASPRWIVRRPHDGGRILIARDELDEDGTQRVDGQRLADYAERLGKEADKLAEADPLLPPDRVAESHGRSADSAARR